MFVMRVSSHLGLLLYLTSLLATHTVAKAVKEAHLRVQGEVNAGECSPNPTAVNLQSHQFSVFASPNFPQQYGAGQNCHWKFQVPEGVAMSLRCEVEGLSLYSYLYLYDGTNLQYISGCDISGPNMCTIPPTFNHYFESTTAYVGLRNDWIYRASGFRCRMDAFSVSSSCECGGSTNSRIIGGQEANPHQYPWMASLVELNPDSNLHQFCGGSLITQSVVLTAAHCFDQQMTLQNTRVQLGLHNTANTADVETKNILNVARHPKYIRIGKLPNNGYDVALVKIEPVTFTPHIRPICLPNNDAPVVEYVASMGWGTLSPNGPPSPVLKEAKEQIVSQSYCTTFSPVPLCNVHSMLCTIWSTGMTCRGDSGGPLVRRTDRGYEVIGVTSFGACAQNAVPNFFARVTSVMDFIWQYAGDELFCLRPTLSRADSTNNTSAFN